MNVVSLIWNYENILDMKIYCETHFVSLQGLFFSKSIKAIITIWRRTFSRLSYAKIICIFLAFDAKDILHSLCRKMLKKGKNVFLHIYVCIICCWHILLGWAITWWHYSSYVMLGNKFKPKLFLCALLCFPVLYIIAYLWETLQIYYTNTIIICFYNVPSMIDNKTFKCQKLCLTQVNVNTVKMDYLKREYVTTMDFVIICIFGNMYLVDDTYTSDWQNTGS